MFRVSLKENLYLGALRSPVRNRRNYSSTALLWIPLVFFQDQDQTCLILSESPDESESSSGGFGVDL